MNKPADASLKIKYLTAERAAIVRAHWTDKTVYPPTLAHALSVHALFNGCDPKRIEFVIDEDQMVVNP